jgi:hypothetical protein
MRSRADEEAPGERPHLTGGSDQEPGGLRAAHTSLATMGESEVGGGCQSAQETFRTAPGGTVPNFR